MFDTIQKHPVLSRVLFAPLSTLFVYITWNLTQDWTPGTTGASMLNIVLFCTGMAAFIFSIYKEGKTRSIFLSIGFLLLSTQVLASYTYTTNETGTATVFMSLLFLGFSNLSFYRFTGGKPLFG